MKLAPEDSSLSLNVWELERMMCSDSGLLGNKRLSEISVGWIKALSTMGGDVLDMSRHPRFSPVSHHPHRATSRPLIFQYAERRSKPPALLYHIQQELEMGV